MATAEVRSSDRILQSALDLFASKGYDATSVREICEAAGITKPTLYHFYKSKEGVYRALVEGTLEAFHGDLERQLQQPGPIAERLKRVARGYFETARGNRQWMRFVFGLVHNPSGTAPPTDFPRFYDQVVERIARAVRDGVSAGELRPGPIDVRMLVFMGALGESVCGWLICGRPQLAPELADALVDSIIEGWSAQ